MKKTLSLLLTLLMFLSVLCGCAQPADDGNTDTSADTTPAKQSETADTSSPAETTDKYDIGDTLPELNYGGDSVMILSRGRDWCDDEVSVTDMNGEPINDAIYNRNLEVEARLGVKIENIMTSGSDNYEISDMIRTQVNSATDEYDMLANSVYSTIMYTGEGLFQNLYECEYLDLDQIWWAQGFNEAASIGDAQYFVTGAIALSTYRFIFATFFNRNMFDSAGIDYPYDAVNSGKWTLDYQYEISSGFYEDLNGDSTHDDVDKYGFVTNADMIGVDAYWSSCKLPILSKTEDNYLEYSMDIDRLSTAVEKINHLIWENDGAFSVKHASADSEQETIAEMFAEDRAAMVTLRLIEAEGAHLRNMTSDYGIVPVPKLDESQTQHYSYAHDTFTAFAVPVTVTDDRLQQMGAVLEAMASESYRTVLPAYYEITLKDKYCNDPESCDMLDTIIEGFYVDAGVLYTKQINSVHQKLRGFIGSNVNNVASIMKSLDKMVPKQLDTLLDGIKKVQG
ncbi:MAG: hypothetical protein IJY27_07795 [Clostridia bacterium]|nr:hypothetical protein [Clostridia bacterium]